MLSYNGKDCVTAYEHRYFREKRDEILRIAGRYGASNVRIFGSFSRADADDKSDVDILVDLEQVHSLSGSCSVR